MLRVGQSCAAHPRLDLPRSVGLSARPDEEVERGEPDRSPGRSAEYAPGKLIHHDQAAAGSEYLCHPMNERAIALGLEHVDDIEEQCDVVAAAQVIFKEVTTSKRHAVLEVAVTNPR